ncbi:protein DpdG [Vibrio alginolyticus]|uniref:protein DpdG n=1 Tax=Vibrio alginolyticus TaxID=663 RepID=UPI00375447F6
MPITNNAHGGSQFEVLTVIRNVLESNRRKPMTKDAIVSWCRPETLAYVDNARSKVDQEVNAWKDLGLLSKTEDGLVLNSYYFKDTDVSTSTGARRCLLAEDNNLNLDARDQRAVDLTKLVCMILSLDVYRYPEIRSSNLADIVDTYLSDFRINRNETAVVPSYLHWLGYAARIGNGSYTIDPTNAIKEELLAPENSIEKNKQLTIEDFLKLLAKRLPVIDGGVYRVHIEKCINSKNWSKPSDSELSTSLSRALLRLHHMGTIRLQKLSDAGLRNLKGPNKKVLMGVTHVTVLGDK